jgi:UDP-galactopyranose mutase
LVYDCVDFFAAAHPERKKEVLRKERLLLARSDLVVAISRVLQRHLSQMTTKGVYLVPQGFRIKDFKKIKAPPRKIKGENPLIGFAGGVNTRINYDLLLSLAKRNPKWDFVVWGPLLEKERFDEKTRRKFEKLISLPNIITGEVQKRDQIPSILRQFDVAMIPYDSSQDFNRYCYPMKIFEFFYLGKPTVSTYIEEFERFPKYIKISDSVVGWEKIIKTFLSRPWPKEYQRQQRKLAEENSWDEKVKSILTQVTYER